MQQLEERATSGETDRNGKAIEGRPIERRRVEQVVQTLATLHSEGESLAEVAHDARNMVTALGLYCDLLEEPGVLTAPYMHYGNELRLVASASRRLVEKLVSLESGIYPMDLANRTVQSGSELWPVKTAASKSPHPMKPSGNGTIRQFGEQDRRADLLPSAPISNLASELLSNRNLLSALAGPAIGLTMDANGGPRPVRLTGEELTRVLVNLVKNSTEAMPEGGRIHIALRQRPAAAGAAECLVLTVEDNGPGIAQESLERIFVSGYTTRGDQQRENGGWPLAHRGLGLAITRSIIEAAGGRIWASNREQRGARFEIELPMWRVNY